MLVDIEKSSRREIPHEPGEWMDLRALSAGDMEQLSVDGQRITLTIEMAARSIAGWSYPTPVSKDSVRKLDLGTFQWVSEAILAVSGLRSAAEKNESGASSQPTTERVAAPTQANSLI